MNIAIISYHTCPLATLGGKDTGGMNVYVRDLTRYLGTLGIHADVFTRSQDEHVPHVLHELGCGNRVVHIPAGPEVPMPKKESQNYLPEFVENIIKFSTTKEIKYDVIHSHYWLSGLAGLDLSAEWNTPIVHMFHTLALLKNKIAQSNSELEGEFRIEGEKKVVLGADKLIAATVDEKKHLIDLYQASEQKISIIPPGVDKTRFYPIPNDEAKAFLNIPSDEKMILFVGRIEPLKGIDTLIRAIAQLRKSDVLSKCPHYLYIIGGEQTNVSVRREMEKLKKLCLELGVGDLILFVGSKDQATLPYYYSAAEIVVMPSNYESFGMVALEAMACGTPVVASQVGGLQHLVIDQETGFTIPHNNPDALEQALTYLMCKPEMRIEMSRKSVAYASTFSWEVITPKVAAIYEDLLET